MAVCTGNLNDYDAVPAAFHNLYVMMTENVDIDGTGGGEGIPKIRCQLVRVRQGDGRKGLVRSFRDTQQ